MLCWPGRGRGLHRVGTRLSGHSVLQYSVLCSTAGSKTLPVAPWWGKRGARDLGICPAVPAELEESYQQQDWTCTRVVGGGGIGKPRSLSRARAGRHSCRNWWRRLECWNGVLLLNSQAARSTGVALHYSSSLHAGTRTQCAVASTIPVESQATFKAECGQVTPPCPDLGCPAWNGVHLKSRVVCPAPMPASRFAHCTEHTQCCLPVYCC